ncbi:zinc dependent phospholipase C family protein [Campylobacterota bacterium DY0563]
MAGAYAHITAVSMAGTDSVIESMGFSQEAYLALLDYLPFTQLGSISPDYPYLAFFNHTKWADFIHFGMETKQIIELGIEEVKRIENIDDKSKAFAWLCGFVGHIVTDVVIHPVVELKVGTYEENKAEHRTCEMHQDVYIYQTRFNYGIIANTEHISYMAKVCSEDESREQLDHVIAQLWDNILKKSNPSEYELNKPEIHTWHERFTKLVSIIEETQNLLLPLSRHMMTENGLVYPTMEGVNRTYIENLEVPEGTMHYDEIFDKAVSKVREVWKILDDAIFNDDSENLDYFANWNLDTGRRIDNQLEYWA